MEIQCHVASHFVAVGIDRQIHYVSMFSCNILKPYIHHEKLNCLRRDIHRPVTGKCFSDTNCPQHLRRLRWGQNLLMFCIWRQIVRLSSSIIEASYYILQLYLPWRHPSVMNRQYRQKQGIKQIQPTGIPVIME